MRSGKVETAQLGLIAVPNTDGLPNGSVIFDTDQRINVSRQSKTISLIEDEGFPTVNLSGIYWTNNRYEDVVNDVSFGSNCRYYFPFYLPANLTCDSLRTTVTYPDATGLYSVAIYNSNTNGLPQNKVLEHLAISTATTGDKDLNFSPITLKKGLYWVVFWCSIDNEFNISVLYGLANTLGVLGFNFDNGHPYTHFAEYTTYNTGSFPATAPTFTLADRETIGQILFFGLRVA